MPATWNGDILTQDLGSPGCGPCCVAMAIKLMRKAQLTYDQLLEKGQGLATADSAPSQAGWDDKTGATPRFLLRILESYAIRATYTSNPVSIKEAIRGSSPASPRIVQVDYSKCFSGGLHMYHWVVISGRQKHIGRPSTYTVLDPAASSVTTNIGSDHYTSSKRIKGQLASGPFVMAIICENALVGSYSAAAGR